MRNIIFILLLDAQGLNRSILVTLTFTLWI